jgi:pimeloyl-ACP methyl ester carboxylesterase
MQLAGRAEPEPFLARPPTWYPSEFDARLEFADIEVPLDYFDAAGRSITIAISRYKATDPVRRRGILLSVNGGPGGNNGDGRLLPGMLGQTPLNEIYDMVGFDPRGTGASTQVTAETSVANAVFDSRPPDSAFATIADDMRLRDEACQRGGGDLRPHITTRNTARDMDVIRVLLGEPKINFVGWAYGTLVGSVYGTMFGAYLDYSVLDSSVHPDWDWHQQFRWQAVAIRESVDKWAAWVSERQEHFGLGTSAGDVVAGVEEVVAFLEGALASTAMRTSFDGLVGTMAPDRPQWAELASIVGQLRKAVAARDEAAARDLLDRNTGWRPGDGQQHLAVLEAVTCETRWPADLEVYYEDMRVFRERYPYGYGVMRAMPWVSAFQTVDPTEERTRVTRTNYPTGIVVQADSDPLDHHDGGYAMAARLRHRLITVSDSGEHEIYALGSNSGVDFLVNRYLMEGILPPDRTECVGAAMAPDIPADQVRSSAT